jgi:hypothetical protein
MIQGILFEKQKLPYEAWAKSPFSFLKLLLVTAATAVTVKATGTGREKVIGRELDFAENVARTIGRIVALLFGYTEIIYRH